MKLGLGTAQFGLAYGITGPGVRVSLGEVKAILDLARKRNVTMLDTAPAYGDSEAVLGECLAGGGGFGIVTKTIAAGGARIAGEDVARLDESFTASLARLRVNSVDGVLVHRADDLLAPGGDRIYELLAQWRGEGRTRKIGVSVYTREQIDALFERHLYDIVQLPVSVFDQRLVADGTLEMLKRAGVEIHARSVLLQGLALMEPSNIPAALQPARPLVERFRRTLAGWGLSPLAGALRYVNGLAAIDRVVIGVHSAAQLEECLRAVEASAGEHDYSAFACANEAIVDPRQWKAA